MVFVRVRLLYLDVMVVDGDSVVPTDKGDIPLHELNKNPVG